MAQSLSTTSGVAYIPGGYSTIRVQNGTSGLATSGVLLLVGEADQGDAYTLEPDLENNSFGPDQLADVQAKYGSGPLVDAFRAACAPADDPQIGGSFAKAVMVKTNASTKASGNLTNVASGTYGTLVAKSSGKVGNLITYVVTADTSEALPTTGAFTWIPNVDPLNADFRVTGAASVPLTVGINTSPSAFVTAVDGLSGVAATGGATRGVLPGLAAGTLTLSAVANAVTITRSVAFAVTPTVGDTMIIPTGSVLAGGTDQNVGGYVVTGVTSTTISATKLSDAGKTLGAAPVAGEVTAPVAVGTTAMAATSDVQCFAPVTITLEAGSVVDGVGKTLEINALTTGTDLLTRCAYAGSITPVTFISTSATPVVIAATSEYKAKLTVSRAVDNLQEILTAGGDIALKVSYTGTTATVTITDTAVTSVVAGGSGAALPAITLADYPTIADLASFINAQTGWKAAVGSAAAGNLPTSALDNGTFNVCSTFGAHVGRIKADGYNFFNTIKDGSALVQLNTTPTQAAAGLPVVAALAYLAGGLKGSTTSEEVLAAIDALEAVHGNFVIPLFSQDASRDIIAGLTESGSTYTIEAINLAVKTHVLKMSTLKKRRNRQAFLSIEDTFANQKEAASNLSSSRCSVAFQDFKQLTSAGTIKQFQPWMGAVIAAAMQAAGFYKAIFFKGINTVGTVHADGSFKENNDSQVEEALKAGLMPARKAQTGGFIWVSDQTSYIKDENFVYNSVQAVYTADLIALTTAQKMEKAFVGQSVADISAALALSYLEGLMAEFLRLKLIAPSDDALKGFKNAKIRINGGSMFVSVEIKLAGALYFSLIDFLVSPVVQSA